MKRAVGSLGWFFACVLVVLAVWVVVVWELYYFGHRLHFRQTFGGPLDATGDVLFYFVPLGAGLATTSVVLVAGVMHWRRLWLALPVIVVVGLAVPVGSSSMLTVKDWPINAAPGCRWPLRVRLSVRRR